MDILSVTQYPELIIDVMASIVAETSSEVQIIIEKYKEIINNDRKLLVPVIGSLAELDLPEELKLQVFEMSGMALTFVDENDVPTVVRTLLHSISKSTYSLFISFRILTSFAY